MKRSIRSAKFAICLGSCLLLSGGLIYLLSDLNFSSPAQAAQDQEKERKEAAIRELASQLRVERIGDRDARAGSVSEAFAELIEKAQGGERVRVIVGLRVAFEPEGRLANRAAAQNQRLAIAQSQSRLLTRLSAFGVTSVKRLDHIPFLAMEVDLAALRELEKDPEVTSIREDAPIRISLVESVPLVGAPAAWAAGFSGVGQHVAVLDTGVDKSHAFLTGKVVSEACYSTTSANTSSVCPGGVAQTTAPDSGVPCASPTSQCLHGTHVAGIAAGRGPTFHGVARDANLIAIQVFSRGVTTSFCGGAPPCVSAFPSDVLLGLGRVQTLSSSLKIAAVNLSLGGVKFASNCDTAEPAYKAAIDSLRSLGIATVAAAGNNGYAASTSRPACVSSAISVGSTGDGTGGATLNGVSSFSNTAHFLNLFAPGEFIYSSVPGGAFMGLAGTSMAAAHVAGAWAALKSKTPNASVSQVLMALQGNGLPVTDTRNGIIKPRLRVDTAINALSTTACNYSLSGATQSLNAAAGAGSTNVTSTSGCAWTAISNVPWITVNSGATGSGNGSVNFSVAANTGLDRTGSLVIAGQTFIVNQAGGPSLAVDDGNHEEALGLNNGGAIYAVNRLTPASYPAAINQVAIFFPSQLAVPVGSPVTVLYAANPSGGGDIGGNFNTVNGTVQALDQFNYFSIPPFAITGGDFLVGFRVSHAASQLPVVLDTTAPRQRRSYVSTDGANFTLIDDISSTLAGNLGIRALLAPRAVAGGGSTLKTESCFPANNRFDTGETVTVDLPLQNAGYEAISNLVATLQATGGVTLPGPPQTYGALPPGSPPMSRSFSFTVGANCGEAGAATWQLQDGATNLGAVSFTFPTGAPSPSKTYGYTGSPGAIPDPGTVEFPITVTGAGVVFDVNARLRINHGFAADLDIFLVGPDGTTVELTTDNGGSGDNYGGDSNDCSGSFTVFDDSAAIPITSGSPPFTGEFKPEGLLSAFNGKPMAGVWRLRIIDDDSFVAGTLGCWQLEITDRPPLCCIGRQCALLAGINQTSGAPGGSVIITGMNLTGVAAVRFANNVNAQFTVNSDTQITAIVPAAAVAGPITISKPPCPDVQTAAFTVLNPLPVASTLSPASTIAGGAGFTLTVNGSNFVNGSVVRWNGSPRPTNFVSNTQLTAAITAADIALAGVANITVFNPTPGGGTSNASTFTINNPVPVIGALNPSSTIVGGVAFSLIVTGTSFVNGSIVRWNGSDRTTNFISPTQMNATITAADIATAGAASVTIFNPAPGGGTTSASTFTINNPGPVLSQISPNTAIAGTAAFTLNLTGASFVNGSIVRWNGSDRTTTFVSNTQLTAAIAAADIATAGTASATVFNPAPGGGTSNALTFTINNPVPVIGALNPNATLAGGAAFTLNVTGSNFVNGSIARWNGSDRTTTFISPTQVNVAITAADIATAGTASITVFNPAPGGGTSGASTFTINNPVPTITQLDPNSVTIGGAAFTLNVMGTNFINNSVVRWNESDRPTTFVNSTQLRAAITAADIATTGAASVTVFNPGPGGGLSNTSNFTVVGVPDLTIAKTHTGNFTVGASGVYTLRVTNNGSAATTGAITVTDTLPNGLSFRSADGAGWSCAANGQTVTCANAGPLATGASSSFTLTVGVASAAAPSVTNTASVSTTGDTNSANNSASDPTTVVCEFTVAPLNHSFTSAGGQGSVTITTETGCAWTAVSNATRITVNSGASGTGNGTVTFTVADNTTDTGRAGALTVAGKTVNVTQSARVTVVSGASFRAGDMAAESIGAAFGSNLATTTMVAPGLPLPTELAGTTVKVRDGAGTERLCPLFFVAPDQINFIVAPGTANGAATVTITSGSGAVSTGVIRIATVAPTLFSANSDGQGPAAGVALRVIDGAQTFEQIVEFDAAQNRFVTKPIDLSEGEVFLILFGSGFRSRSSLSAVTCAIGGLSQEALYAGASSDLVGVDQINVRLSRNLIGRGEVDVALTVDGKPANVVRVNFR